MTKGGYQIIDLKNKALTSGVGMKFDGVYDKVKGTHKPILVCGLNVGGTEYHDSYVDFTVAGTAYTGTIYGKTIKIEDTDVVTVTNAG